MTTIAMNVLMILADAATTPATPTTAGGQPPSLFSSWMFPLLMVMLIWMFFSFNSKRKQDKARQAQLAAMKRGDRIQTIGGILGTIVEVRDSEVVVKVDESNNTKIKFARSAVAKLSLEEEKEKTETAK